MQPGPAGSKPFDVVGFGQNSVDLVAVVSRYPEPDSHTRVDRFAELPGGEIATAMVACARLGCRARYVGTIGSNSQGALVRATLAKEGVDVAKIRQVDAPNRLALILVDPAGTRTVLWHRDARLAMTSADVDLDAVTSGRVLLVDAIDPDASTTAARAAREQGIVTVADIDAVQPGVDLLLSEVDIIIAAGPFPEALTGATGLGAGLEQMAERYHSAMIVATLGSEGTLTRLNGRELRTPAAAVDVVDTTGAGDAFRGGFIASWIRLGNERGIDTVLEYASVVAALNCRALGAQTALPSWDQVEQAVTRAAGDRSN